jgi:hypothetical protein
LPVLQELQKRQQLPPGIDTGSYRKGATVVSRQQSPDTSIHTRATLLCTKKTPNSALIKNMHRKGKNVKAILEFNLPEENSEFLMAQRGGDYFSYLWDLDQQLRSWLKHNNHEFKTVNEALEKIREGLNNEVDFNGIN